ncbi:hypothetical protein PGQ11_009105 [Apiospora arundinis]|uniref:Uncharacterized protein n=1 Tax=Apiospora arundinis TaxID=335852 RepID=A0ABR2IH19_9PEZI
MAVDKDAAAPPCLVVHGTSWARLWMPKRLGSGSDWTRQPRVVPRAAGRVPVGKVLLAAFIVVDKDDVGGGLFALIVDKDEVGSGLFALVRVKSYLDRTSAAITGGKRVSDCHSWRVWHSTRQRGRDDSGGQQKGKVGESSRGHDYGFGWGSVHLVYCVW